MQRITFEHDFITLNEYIKAERANKFHAAKIKSEESQKAWYFAKLYPGIKPRKPVFLIFNWVTKNERIDPDNTAFARKFILDGLVTAGTLTNDGRKQVVGFMDLFEVAEEKPRVEVYFLDKKKVLDKLLRFTYDN
jgi:hypothetical protein